MERDQTECARRWPPEEHLGRPSVIRSRWAAPMVRAGQRPAQGRAAAPAPRPRYALRSSIEARWRSLSRCGASKSTATVSAVPAPAPQGHDRVRLPAAVTEHTLDPKRNIGGRGWRSCLAAARASRGIADQQPPGRTTGEEHLQPRLELRQRLRFDQRLDFGHVTTERQPHRGGRVIPSG